MTYLPFIDGLRGVAVLVILLFHLDVAFLPGGFIGVDIFFVISGYLITRIIADEMREGNFSFANFYARRIKRIFPALFFMLLCAFLMATVSFGMDEFTDFLKTLRHASAQVSNFYFNRKIDYFDPDQAWAPLLHTWSLGVEEQFYAVWPLLMLAVYKFGGPKKWPVILGAVFVISLGVSEFLVRTEPLQAFYMLHSRAWQLALGGLVAIHAFPDIKDKTLNAALAGLGAAIMIAPVFFYTSENFPGLKALLPCLGVALIFYTNQNGPTLIHKALTFRPLVLTGLISYSLYLWHWPLIAFYKQYMGTSELTPDVQMVIAVASFVMAIISYFAVEQPLRRIKQPPSRVIAAGLAMIVLFIVGGNLVKEERDAPWRVTYQVDPLEREPHDLDRVCSVTGGKTKEECIVGPNKDKYEVILAGDSNGSHFTPMILAWAKERGLTVRLFVRSACATWLYQDTMPMRYGRPDEDCKELIKEFHDILKTDKSIRYIFLGKNLPADTPLVRASLEDIQSHNIPVYFLGAIPRFEKNPHKCQIRNHVLLSKWIKREEQVCTSFDPAYYNKALENVPGLKELLQERGIPYFDPIPHMQAAYDEEGHFMLLDESHLNRYGSTHLIPAFKDFMKAHDREERGR